MPSNDNRRHTHTSNGNADDDVEAKYDEKAKKLKKANKFPTFSRDELLELKNIQIGMKD